MYPVDLIANREGAESLKSFAAAFFDALGIAAHEERESDNYTGGAYFVGTDKGLEVNISISDDPRHEAMPYWIELSTADALTLESRIRERLLPLGFRVARVLNFGEPTEHCEFY
jgi:hypothetical protein